jgi:vesicle coat complex subunit
MQKGKESNATPGGNVYFQNSRNTEISEIQAELNSMKVDQQKEAMKQIIASMTIGKDVSSLFPHVVKCMRTTNIELKKLIYLYIINYAKAKPDLTFLAVAAFHSDAINKSSPILRALAVRTMGCIRVNMIVSYLCDTLTNCLKDEDAYVRKTAVMCVAKLYNTNPEIVKENGFLTTLQNMLTDGNAHVVANSLAALNEISILSGENLIKLRSKVLKRVLLALNEANEWGQVYILDALVYFTPKKTKQAEDIIEATLPRLTHANPSVVMSSVKVILKFLDYIESIESVRSHCKKISNSLMTIMMSSPENQYVLLRSLKAVVQKRPYLLDKDFKYFFVQYNDPIYVKLEKIDILYKLCDNKNFESILSELKSYALTEVDVELVKKSIKYMGYIGFKFEKAVELCVESLKELLDHHQESAICEGIQVARDLMRKYKGKSLELVKKIDSDFIKSISEPEGKCAVLFIIGEFCNYMKNSTDLIAPFIEGFNEESSPAVKLQILNAIIKNYLNKPNECEELVKVCLQKGAEESENPDVRDRSYIYWRLLENDPDLAKEMIAGEKRPFEFNEEEAFDQDILDDIINNMTNVSGVYHRTNKSLIPREDMIIDADDGAQPEKKDSKRDVKSSKGPRKSADDTGKSPTIAVKEVVNQDADLLGLDEDNNGVSNVVNNILNTKQTAGSIDIFDIFGKFGSNSPKADNNIIPENKNEGVNFDDFGFVNNDGTLFDESSIPVSIFNPSSGITVPQPALCYKSEEITIHSSFHRENGKILLGLFIINKTKSNIEKVDILLANNSFGLNVTSTIQSLSKPIGENSYDKVIYRVEIDQSKNDKNPPSVPFKINAKLRTNLNQVTFSIPLVVNALFTEEGKLANKQFVEFFSANKDNPSNVVSNFTSSSIDSEDTLNKRFERNNIFLIAKQSKYDPPLIYYSLSISGKIIAILECSLQKKNLRVKVISSLECISSLIREAIDLIIS